MSWNYMNVPDTLEKVPEKPKKFFSKYPEYRNHFPFSVQSLKRKLWAVSRQSEIWLILFEPEINIPCNASFPDRA